MNKKFLGLALLATSFALISCSSGSDDPDPETVDAAALEAVRDITTLEDFTATIVGRQLVLRNEDGSRNPDAQLSVNADMKVTGFVQSGDVDLDWYWDDMAWCRSGVSGLPDNAMTLELDCQGVDVDNDVVNFTRDRGQGELASSWFIE